jgi:hypothetical protein
MDRGFTYPAGLEMSSLRWHFSGSRVVADQLTPAEAEEIVWLSEAHAVIKAWEKQGFDTRLLTVAEADALAERISSTLQCAYDQGRFASSSAADNT